MRHPSRPDLERAFNARFCAIVRQAREKVGLSQQSMAAKLGLTRARYKQFEAKAPLPPAYLIPFAVLTDTSIGQLLHTAVFKAGNLEAIGNPTALPHRS
jgi:transcriptional regulator with XRE-family HTH domain